MYAASKGHSQVVETLITQYHADFTSRDNVSKSVPVYIKIYLAAKVLRS